METRIKLSKTRSLFSLGAGIWLACFVYQLKMLPVAGAIVSGLVLGIIIYQLSGYVIARLRRAVAGFNRGLDTIAVETLLGGAAGLLLGVLVGVLSAYPISLMGRPFTYLTIGLLILCGYLGMKIGASRAEDLLHIIPVLQTEDNHIGVSPRSNCKVLDTSAIIDGRIYDVCLSRFLEGPLVVPTFVIEELQHIADSSDNVRRNKGRRGLELLSKMQKHTEIIIDIIETNIPEEKDVDAKLVRLCKQMKASIITNDYNLNKVAELQGIPVLNINELANAVKVIVYPGETMPITIIKGGKEPGQGVGYLEDGTMVVVEDAQEDIGNELEVMVTSVFQTAAGRMIFTRKIREESASGINHSFQGGREVNLYG